MKIYIVILALMLNNIKGFSQSFTLINGPRIFFFKTDKRFARNAPLLVFDENILLNKLDTLKSNKILIKVIQKKSVYNIKVDSIGDLSKIIIVILMKGKIENAISILKNKLDVPNLKFVKSSTILSYEPFKESEYLIYEVYSY